MNGFDKELCRIIKLFYEKSKTDTVDAEAFELVKAWQRYLSENHYECTDEMLECLGKMYPSEEFRDKIDAFGKGTADYMSRAILKYCSEKKA